MKIEVPSYYHLFQLSIDGQAPELVPVPDGRVARQDHKRRLDILAASDDGLTLDPFEWGVSVQLQASICDDGVRVRLGVDRTDVSAVETSPRGSEILNLTMRRLEQVEGLLTQSQSIDLNGVTATLMHQASHPGPLAQARAAG